MMARENQAHIPYGRLIRICGLLAASAGGIALFGWILGLPFLASLGSEKIPMAPSSALLFLLYGGAACGRARGPGHRGAHRLGVVINYAGALVALLLFVLSCQAVYLDAERLGFAAVGTVDSAPIGHMSPVTAIGFLLASLSFWASLPSCPSRPWRAVLAWGSACLLLIACSVMLLAYLYGAPLLYGAAFVPPAATTCLAFAALGGALLALAGPQAWPRDGSAAAATRPAPVLLLVFILFAVGIITAGYFYFRSYEAHYRRQVERELSSIAELKVSELVQYRKERLGDGGVFLRNAASSALAQRVFDDPADNEAHTQLGSWLSRVLLHYQYDRVSLFDARGALRIVVPESAQQTDSVVSRRVLEVLRSREVVVQDFYRDEHDQRIYLTIFVPILGPRDGAQTLGVLALRIDPTTFLYPFIRRWPTASATAETLLVRREGDDALFLNQLRFNRDAALTVRIPLATSNALAVAAVRAQEGILEGPDYRGVSVIGDVRAVPDSPWFLVTKRDAAEVYAPLRERMWMTVLLIGSLLAVAGAGIGGAWRQQQAGFYRERYEAERDRAWLRDVIARSHSEIYVFDPDTLRFTFANIGACRNIGYSAEELTRLTPLDITSAFTEQSFRALLRPLRAGESGLIVFETVHRRKDGSEYPVEVHLQYVDAGGGGVFLAFVADITERKQLESQLRQAQKMEAIGRLAGGIAHDFNNQIFVINGYCDLLLGEAAGQPALLEPLYEIKKAARRSAQLTAHLLAFSRKQLLQPKVIDLNAELVDIETMLRRLIGEDIRLTFMLGEDVGHVKADPNQLQQVVMNLAVNARDAMPRGGQLTIETKNVELDDAYAQSQLEVRPGRYVLLSLSDTGHGMDRETLARIFEPFFTTKGPGMGTGLGLSTVQGVVKQSGGHIAAYSEPGAGTTFKIYLPRVDEPVEATEPRITEDRVGGSETILLVEDEAAVRELVGRVLAAQGYHVLRAADGREALQLAGVYDGPIHLLLTDVVMPAMSGAQLAERLKVTRPDTQVIYMSGYTENAIVHHGVLAAELAFLPKPCPTDVLLRKVREILDARPRKDVRGSRILVVDDSEDERTLQAYLLAKAGCVVLTASSAADALGVLEREAVDAVVTDLNMPGMDGFGLTEAIRRLPRWRTLPVVVLSGAYSENDQARSHTVGATACLSKGTADERSLLDILGKVL